MKKVTAFIFDLSKGGAQGVFVTVVNYFVDIGYTVEVVVQNLNDDIYRQDLRNNINVISLDCQCARDSFRALLKYVKNSDIEIAWIFGPELAVDLYIVKKITRSKFPIYARSINTLSSEFNHTKSFFRKYVTHTLIKVFYRYVDGIVAQSENMGKDLIDNYGFEKSKVFVINNALSEKYEKEISTSFCAKKENYILYAGRLEEQKGLNMLLSAFSIMNNKCVELYIIGDGSQKDKLVNLSYELDIDKRVRFIPHSNKIEDYYRAAKITVLSSYFEGFPNVLIESLACGTAIVAFDLPSGPSEIISEDNGILVEYLNIEEFAKACDLALNIEWNEKKIKQSAKRYTRSNVLGKYRNIMEVYQDTRKGQ